MYIFLWSFIDGPSKRGLYSDYTQNGVLLMPKLQVHISSLSQNPILGNIVSDDSRKNKHQNKTMNLEKISIQLPDLYTMRKSSLLYLASIKKMTQNVKHIKNN